MISVNASPVLRRMQKLEVAFGRRGLQRLALEAKSVVRAAALEAFSRQADPATGKPWEKRKSPGSWALLQKSGTLRGLVSSEVKTLDRVAYIKGTVRNATTPSGSPYQVVANVQFYGRKDNSIPPRPFMGLSTTKRRTIVEKARAYLRGALR